MLAKKIQHLAQQQAPKFIEWRRHLHQHPEPSFEEYQTASFVEQQLKGMGIPTQRMASTGVIGILEGKEPHNRVLALRADMDALPILEANEVPYKSKREGWMHACGHDVHTTCLLGAAQLLQQTNDQWRGTIKLIFQPGEEKLPGGASLLIEEGVLEQPAPQYILGQHVEPPLEVGKVGIKSGLFMASADEIYLTIKGKGGHGARPHQCVDTILMASQVIVQLQQLVSRRADPLMPTVLTFGKIYSEGGATNIIPNEVQIYGTFRTFDEAWRSQAHDLLTQMTHGICQSMGGTCVVDIVKGSPFLNNDPDLTQQVRQQMETYLGAENVVELPARMGGEDFALYTQHLPACFYRLGVQNPNGTGLHTPTFDVDERCLSVGVGLMAWLATQELA